MSVCVHDITLLHTFTGVHLGNENAAALILHSEKITPTKYSTNTDTFYLQHVNGQRHRGGGGREGRERNSFIPDHK